MPHLSMPYDFYSRLDKLGNRMNALAKVSVTITRGSQVSPPKDAHRTSIRMEEAGDEAVITITRHTTFYFQDCDYQVGGVQVVPVLADIITDCDTGYRYRVVSGLDAMKMSNDIPPYRYVTGTNKRLEVMTVRIG